MDKYISTRLSYLLATLCICSLLLISLYLQFVDGFIPCPLCTLQRLTFLILGFLFLIGIFVCKYRFFRFFLPVCTSFFSLLGAFFAGRQWWVQHFPTVNQNECGVSLGYMMQVLSLPQLIQKIMEGGIECAQRGWEFLSLNMAEWAFIWFGLFLILSLYLIYKKS